MVKYIFTGLEKESESFRKQYAKGAKSGSRYFAIDDEEKFLNQYADEIESGEIYKEDGIWFRNIYDERGFFTDREYFMHYAVFLYNYGWGPLVTTWWVVEDEDDWNKKEGYLNDNL